MLKDQFHWFWDRLLKSKWKNGLYIYLKVEILQFEFPNEEDQHIEHNRILQNFTNFLLGKEDLHVPGDQGINSVELINAMILSGLNKKEIELPLNEEEYENKLKKMIGNK